MFNRFACVALGLGLLAAGPAAALTLGQIVRDTSSQIDIASDLAYDVTFETLDFSGSVTGTTSDLTAAGLFFAVGVAQVDSFGAAIIDAGFDDFGLIGNDGSGVDTPLVGQIEDIAFGAATASGTGIEILFRTVLNTLGAAYDGYFLATITEFAGEDAITGPTGLPDGTDLRSISALTAINPVSISAVPLPGALWFLLAGLGGFGVVRARRAA